MCTGAISYELHYLLLGTLHRDAANKEVFKSRAVRGLLSKDLPLASRSWGGGVAALPLHQVQLISLFPQFLDDKCV